MNLHGYSGVKMFNWINYMISKLSGHLYFSVALQVNCSVNSATGFSPSTQKVGIISMALPLIS